MSFRRGGRAVDCTGLENRQALTGLGGSNPSLSAKIQREEFRFVRELFFKTGCSKGFEAKTRPVLPATLGAGNTGQKTMEGFLSIYEAGLRRERAWMRATIAGKSLPLRQDNHQRQSPQVTINSRS